MSILIVGISLYNIKDSFKMLLSNTFPQISYDYKFNQDKINFSSNLTDPSSMPFLISLFSANINNVDNLNLLQLISKKLLFQNYHI